MLQVRIGRWLALIVLGLALVSFLAVVPEKAGAAAGGTIIGKAEKGGKPLPNAAVYVSGLKGSFKPPKPRVTLDQANKTFKPHVVAVMKGGVVELLNSDDFLHNTYAAKVVPLPGASSTRLKKFNSNQPKKGSRSLYRAEDAGLVEVRCNIHAQMQAWIVAVPNPFYAVTDSKGLFRIKSVPAGTHLVRCWSEKYGALWQKMTVSSGGTGRLIFKYK